MVLNVVSQMSRRPATSTRGLRSTEMGPADRAAEQGWRSTLPPPDKGGFPAGAGGGGRSPGCRLAQGCHLTQTLRGSASAHLLPDTFCSART